MISIVIPVYNEERFLPICLDALSKQDTTEQVEIIVVDNNCTDRTLHIALAKNVTVIAEPKLGVGAARRAGVGTAHGDLIVTIDADTALPAHYLKTVRSYFENDRMLACFGGVFTFYDAPQWKNILRPPLARLVYAASWLITRGRVGPMGNNMAFRLSDYNRTRGFNHNFQFGEDMELVAQLREFGRVVLDFNLPVPTSSRRYRLNKDFLVYAANLGYYCFTGRPWRNSLVPTNKSFANKSKISSISGRRRGIH